MGVPEACLLGDCRSCQDGDEHEPLGRIIENPGKRDNTAHTPELPSSLSPDSLYSSAMILSGGREATHVLQSDSNIWKTNVKEVFGAHNSVLRRKSKNLIFHLGTQSNSVLCLGSN